MVAHNFLELQSMGLMTFSGFQEHCMRLVNRHADKNTHKHKIKLKGKNTKNGQTLLPIYINGLRDKAINGFQNY